MKVHNDNTITAFHLVFLPTTIMLWVLMMACTHESCDPPISSSDKLQNCPSLIFVCIYKILKKRLPERELFFNTFERLN